MKDHSHLPTQSLLHDAEKQANLKLDLEQRHQKGFADLESTQNSHVQQAPRSRLRRFLELLVFFFAVVNIALFFGLKFFGHHTFSHISTTLSLLRVPNSYTDFASLVNVLTETPDSDHIKQWSNYYTSGPHLAGQNYSQAKHTLDLWESFGIASSLEQYEVYLNYPIDHRLTLLKPRTSHASPRDNSEENPVPLDIAYEAKLEEDVLAEDRTTGLPNRVPTFHGYSANGNVTASFIFVNYGTYDDYAALLKAGIDLKGKIAIAKYGHCFRGLKVKRAEELGMVGVVIYSDPGDDGNITEENGYQAYPHGPARNPSSVQRGSVQYLSFAPGDPTTIGHPSVPGADRECPKGHIPGIPSLPISYADAIPILQALNGHGLRAQDMGKGWQTGGLHHKGVAYNIGPSPSDVKLNLYNKQEYKITPIWNVIGTIPGSISESGVVIGNHRDAWVAGGAGDPNSGSAVLNEIVRSFGAAVKGGWRPVNQLTFASWDGEEYGLLGSTEHVEQYVNRQTTLAYLNVDVAMAGPKLKVSAHPLLHAVIDMASNVPSANQSVPGRTLAHDIDRHIDLLDAGSDYNAFQYFAGVPSLDVGYAPTKDSPVYHYHSNYDSEDWMNKYGDVDGQRRVSVARFVSVMAAYLVNPVIHSLYALDYAKQVKVYFEEAKVLRQNQNDQSDESDDETIDQAFEDLEETINEFEHAAARFDSYTQFLNRCFHCDWRSLGWLGRVHLGFQIISANWRMQRLDQQFLHQKGLDGRPWYKHVIFGPALWDGYSGSSLPGITESLQTDNQERLEKWLKIVREKVDKASRSLRPCGHHHGHHPPHHGPPPGPPGPPHSPRDPDGPPPPPPPPPPGHGRHPHHPFSPGSCELH